MKESSFHWRKLVMVVVLGITVLGAGSIASVSVAEEHDAFCATCHLNPERIYVDRAKAVAQTYDDASRRGLRDDDLRQISRDSARDLASYHRAAALNCVTCHRGDHGPGDRATALALGARNTLFYLTGQFDADHSGIARRGLVAAGCLRCHVEQPQLSGVDSGADNPVMIDSFENHFHAYLFNPEYAGLTAVGCLDCHPSHLEIPPIVPYFIDEERVVLPTCVQCHIDVKKGPLDL